MQKISLTSKEFGSSLKQKIFFFFYRLWNTNGESVYQKDVGYFFPLQDSYLAYESIIFKSTKAI